MAKGFFAEECNRTACQAPASAFFYNTSTQAFYRQECANGRKGINYWSKRDHRYKICFKVSSVEQAKTMQFGVEYEDAA